MVGQLDAGVEVFYYRDDIAGTADDYLKVVGQAGEGYKGMMTGEKTVLTWFRLGVYVIMGIFLARLMFLTLVLGEYNERMASGNRIRREVVAPLRGTILDRNGDYLAVNKEVDGMVIRHYPLGEIGASITGFVGEISEEGLKECGDECFLGQMEGKAGLEGRYDEQLKGSRGLKLIEEDALGEKTRELERREAVGGEDLRLSISADLQRQVYWAVREMMEDSGSTGAGAVVAKVNGEVLALVSLPSFDPNLFIKDGVRGEEGGVYADALKVVRDETDKPMFNRVISGVYPPGSVYKLVVAAAGLEEGVIDRYKTVEDKGEIKVGGSRFGNWYFDKYGKTEGLVSVEEGLSRSNDIYFYKLGEWLGVDRIVKWSDKMGIGKKTGIDLPGEATGFLPTPLWREKKTGERWFLGNTYHLAIGQGDLLVTPLQVNRWTAGIAAGKICKPRLRQESEVECSDLGLRTETRDVVMAGMKKACMRGGTAFPFFDLEGKIYCKTGTAQQGGEEAEPHAWITVIIPSEKDVTEWVVITVMLEEAGEGSEVAGPVARKIADYILR